MVRQDGAEVLGGQPGANSPPGGSLGGVGAGTGGGPGGGFERAGRGGRTRRTCRGRGLRFRRVPECRFSGIDSRGRACGEAGTGGTTGAGAGGASRRGVRSPPPRIATTASGIAATSVARRATFAHRI